MKEDGDLICRIEIRKGEAQYIAESDLSVVTQGRTLVELLDNLKEALLLHFSEP